MPEQRRLSGIVGVLALLSASLVLPLLSPPAAAFGERVFESNTLIGTDTILTVHAGQSVAQSFAATDTYALMNVTLRLRNTGGTTDTINITIQTDVAGIPSGTILAWSTPITGATVGPVSAPLIPNPVLDRGSIYWIVAAKGGAAGDAYEWRHSGSPAAYGPGKAMVDPGTGWTNAAAPGGTDMWFLTFGRELEANLTFAMAAVPVRVQPKDLADLQIWVNNTGSRSAGNAWVNVTLPTGLSYLSDTANLVPSSTAFPNFTFVNLGNGPHTFVVTTRVGVDIAPATTLTSSGMLVSTNSSGIRQPAKFGSAAMVVGLQFKQLYLVPASPAPQGLTPIPPTGPQVNFNIQEGGAAVDFQLTTPLAGSFRVVNLSALLYLDSASHNVRNLDLNLTLVDVDGAMQTPVAYDQRRVATDGTNGFQLFTYPFRPLDATFPAGQRVLLRVRVLTSGSDDALLATNATAVRSRLEALTPTYVHVDAIPLRDGSGPATVWSPKDTLVIRANVSDPFGTSEVQGAWLNLTDPSWAPVILSAPMAAIATDPASPSAWRLFESTYGPGLQNGTYGIEIHALERNGAKAFATVTALVRAPSMALEVVPTASGVLSGDTFDYHIWHNNSGAGPAGRVWINLSLPAELLFVISSEEANRTGASNWTFADVPPGTPLLIVEVRVRYPFPPMPFLRAGVSLNVTDEKGFRWAELTRTADVVLRGPVVSVGVTPSTDAIHPNETFHLTVSLTNSGDDAGALWANLTLPSTLNYQSDDSASLGGSSIATGAGVSVQLPTLSGGGSWNLDITIRSAGGLARATVHAVTLVLDYTNSRGAMMPSSTAGASVSVVAPVIAGASLVFAESIVVPGDVVAAVLNWTNAGDEAARTIWVNVTMARYLSLASASMAVSVSGSSVRFVLSNVPLGLTYIFLNFTVLSTAPDAAILSVFGLVTHTDRLGNWIASLATAPSNLSTTAPVLRVTAIPASPIVESGTPVTYSIVPTNLGTGTARDVWLNASLPADFLFESDTSDGTRFVVGQDLGWHWQGFAPGSKPFEFTVRVRPSAADRSSSALELRLQSTDENGNHRPDATATLGAQVIAPRIELTLTVSQDRVSVKSGFYYTLRVRNVGTTMARTLFLLDSLSSHLAIDSYTSNVPATGTMDLNWTYQSLQPGDQQVVIVFVRIPEGVEVGTVIPNSIAAVYSNSEGTMVGYAQSSPSLVTVIEPIAILPIVGVAAAMGAVPITFLVYRRRQPRIEEVFLITKDGILIDHLTRNLVDDKDPDIVSGMLTGVQQFARDAFRYGEDRNLHQMQFGDHRLLIERGERVFLAGVCSNGNDAVIGRKLRKAIDEIELKYGQMLKLWDGDMSKVAGIREVIRVMLLGRRRNPTG